MADFRPTNSYARSGFRGTALAVSLLALSACTDGLDLDFRGAAGGLDTTEAARQATERRPNPDDRGIISYPNFQVAVARDGEDALVQCVEFVPDQYFF